MVLVAMQLKVRVPGMALLLSHVTVDILTLFSVAHLELISRSHTGMASVGWSEGVSWQRIHISNGMMCFISLVFYWKSFWRYVKEQNDHYYVQSVPHKNFLFK